MSRNLFSWLIYDTANSFLAVSIGGLFLAQWVILDKGFDDLWYGGMLALSTVLLLLTSPFLGAWSDSAGKRLPFLRLLTIFLVIFLGILALVAVSGMAADTKVFIVLILAFFLQYFYQASLIFYNALLNQLANKNNRGRISGLGEAFGNIGWLIAGGILVLFASGKITLFGEPGRAQVFLPAFLLFGLLALPMFLIFREVRTAGKSAKRLNAGEVYRSTLAGFKDLLKNNKNVAWFLVAFSFISDGLLTVQTYFALVMDAIYKIPDTQKYLIMLETFVPMIVGNYVLGAVGDKVGHKAVMFWSCLIGSVAMVVMFLASSLYFLYFLAPILGACIGGFYVASRALMVKITPKDKLGEYFGFYSAFSRFASIVGPLIWGVTTLSLKAYGILKYQVAGLIVVAFVAVGIYVLSKVEEKMV